MKFIVFLLFITGFVSCQSSPKATQNAKKTKQGQPEFVFQEEFHNFGKLEAGETIAFDFSFENKGTGYLQIVKAVTDCGCITIGFPKEQITPGKDGYIEIVFNTSGEVGKVLKEVQLVTKRCGTKTLTVGANIHNDVINLYSKN